MIASGYQKNPWWAAVLIAAYPMLLPFSRTAEVPLSMLAITGMVLLWRQGRAIKHWPSSRALLLVFLCMWLPMVVSSVDAFNPSGSWYHSLVSLRFFFAALAMAWLSRFSAVRERAMLLISLVLGFWVVDSLIQFIFGVDLLGFPNTADRLNGPFGMRHFRLGMILAVFSPILFEQVRRSWGGYGLLLVIPLTVFVVILSGVRSGWVIIALAVPLFLFWAARRNNWPLLPLSAITTVGAILLLSLAWVSSPLVQERMELSMGLGSGDIQTTDHALSNRIPIWETSLRIFKAYPLVGVGIDSYREAYVVYAADDDPHVATNGIGGYHAHNLILEVLSATGLLGLLGLILASRIMYRLWQQADAASRQSMLPFALALVLLMLPFNSHFSHYGTFLSSVSWWLLGLWMGAFRRRE